MRPAAAEATLFGSIAAFHALDHQVVPERWHVYTHGGAGVASVVAASRLGATAAELGLSPADMARGAAAGALAGGAVAAVVAVGAFIPSAARAFDDPRAQDLDRAVVWRRALLDIPIGTAVYEELVFRSALLGLALRRWSPPVAVAVSSGLFGLWHVLPAIEDRNHRDHVSRYPAPATVAASVVSTAVAGVMFARLRLRTGSVVAPIVAHAIINAAGLLGAHAVGTRRGTDGPA